MKRPRRILYTWIRPFVPACTRVHVDIHSWIPAGRPQKTPLRNPTDPRGIPQSRLLRLDADPGDIPAEPEKTRQDPDGIGEKVPQNRSKIWSGRIPGASGIGPGTRPSEKNAKNQFDQIVCETKAWMLCYRKLVCNTHVLSLIHI